MAILLVQIEDENTLPFNEFFDYNGVCYASTRSRQIKDKAVIDMTSFYDAAVNTEVLRNIPVFFVSQKEHNANIIGWYRKAEIHSKMLTPSLFLEGNIKSYASDAVWLPTKIQLECLFWTDKSRLYEVIEEEDARYTALKSMADHYTGDNQFLRYHSAVPHTIPQALKDLSSCKTACEQWANLVSTQECQDIRDLITLEHYAKKLCEKDRKNSDGYYYLALAYYHLGFIKEGLKQINKALQLEPDASDLIALKGLLLVSKGYLKEGADHLHLAYENSHYEAYLFMEGRTYMLAGKLEQAYDCLKEVEEESLLETMGIQKNDMENKFSFFRTGYRKLKDMILRNTH